MSGHAVVTGGGMMGLLAAGVLARHFERVTLLERDRYPVAASAAPAARAGAPQSRCLHLLLAGGAAAFDVVAPGWRDEMLGLGGREFDVGADTALRLTCGWLPRVRTGMRTFACSRALLERALRTCVARRGAAVHVREGSRVVGLLADQAGRVGGVAVVDRPRGREDRLAAELVVDASGRGSFLGSWLTALRPGMNVEETVVPSRLRYVSQWYCIEPDAGPDWYCMSVAASDATRGCSGMMLRAEHDAWGVVLLAPPGEPLPSDHAAFLAFARRIDVAFGAALARARPVSPIHRYGATPSRWRHYDDCGDWPEGLLAIGDSACALDPYHGAGMSVGARGVALLADHLARAPAEPVGAARFQAELAALNAPAWERVTGCDRRGVPLRRDVEGAQRAHALALADTAAALELLQVHHLVG